MTAQNSIHTCSICLEPYTGFGNNAWPVNEGRCCDTCNSIYVIPQRIANMGKAMAAKKPEAGK